MIRTMRSEEKMQKLDMNENVLCLTKRADGKFAIINRGINLRTFVVEGAVLEEVLTSAMTQNNLGDPYLADSPLSVVGIRMLKGTKTTIQKIMKKIEKFEIK